MGLVGCAVLTILASCDVMAPVPVPNSLDPASIRFKVGDSWSYRGRFLVPGATVAWGVHDTIRSWAVFHCVKDTTMGDSSWVIVEGRMDQEGQDTITAMPSRTAYHFGAGSITSRTFRAQDQGMPVNVLGRAFQAPRYDTAIFDDQVVPISWPFALDTPFSYRPMADPSGALPLRMRVDSAETLTVPGGTFDVLKVHYLVDEMWGNRRPQSILWTDWIGPNGLVRRTVNYGITANTDSFGDTTSLVGPVIDEWEYMGKAQPSPAGWLRLVH